VAGAAARWLEATMRDRAPIARHPRLTAAALAAPLALICLGLAAPDYGGSAPGAVGGPEVGSVLPVAATTHPAPPEPRIVTPSAPVPRIVPARPVVPRTSAPTYRRPGPGLTPRTTLPRTTFPRTTRPHPALPYPVPRHTRPHPALPYPAPPRATAPRPVYPAPRPVPLSPSRPSNTYPTPAYPPPGTRLISVPSVNGRGLYDAERILQQAGLNYGSINVVYASGGDGTVLRSRPAAGTRVPSGSRVDLVISLPG
jgi:hypothetical protein